MDMITTITVFTGIVSLASFMFVTLLLHEFSRQRRGRRALINHIASRVIVPPSKHILAVIYISSTIVLTVIVIMYPFWLITIILP
jgi:hypothetical protein